MIGFGNIIFDSPVINGGGADVVGAENALNLNGVTKRIELGGSFIKNTNVTGGDGAFEFQFLGMKRIKLQTRTAPNLNGSVIELFPGAKAQLELQIGDPGSTDFESGLYAVPNNISFYRRQKKNPVGLMQEIVLDATGMSFKSGFIDAKFDNNFYGKFTADNSLGKFDFLCGDSANGYDITALSLTDADVFLKAMETLLISKKDDDATRTFYDFLSGDINTVAINDINFQNPGYFYAQAGIIKLHANAGGQVEIFSPAVFNLRAGSLDADKATIDIYNATIDTPRRIEIAPLLRVKDYADPTALYTEIAPDYISTEKVPVDSGRAKYKFGKFRTSGTTLSLDTSHYISVEIDGVTYKIALAVTE